MFELPLHELRQKVHEKLGSRFRDNNPNRTYSWGIAFAPFGEQYAVSGSPALSFTGEQGTGDTVTDEYDFLARKLHSKQGRWISPDPAGLSAADLTNPQSWNRYAYVLNNPLNSVDPDGLDCVYDNGDGTFGWNADDCNNSKNNGSGFYFDGTVDLTSIRLNPNGDVVANVDGNTQCSGDCPDVGPRLPPSLTVSAGVDELTPQALQVIGLVATETYQFNKQANCLASAAYPFIPGFKPEDLTTWVGETGADAAGETFESKAEAAAKLAAKYARAKKKGTAQMSRITHQESKMLKDASRLAKGIGYLFAAKEAYDNFNECEVAH